MAKLTIYDLKGADVGSYEIEPTDLAPRINKQLLHDAVVMRATEWSILNRVSRAAVSSLDLQPVLTEIAQACLAISHVESCAIFSWDTVAQEIVVEAGVTPRVVSSADHLTRGRVLLR
jgi:hypothetical protein